MGKSSENTHSRKKPFQLVAMERGQPVVLATLSVRRSRALKEARALAAFYPGTELYLEPFSDSRVIGNPNVKRFQ